MRANGDSVALAQVLNQLPQTSKKMLHHICSLRRSRILVTVCFLMLSLLHVAVFSQPIISKSKPQLLKTHFLPLMEKLKKVSAFIFLYFHTGRLSHNIHRYHEFFFS